jgi:quercetin dioxygenase-like cupin family protein
MQMTRAASAPSYSAPEHKGMEMIRLQGREATDTRSVWVGRSLIAPGGGTSLKASPQEKIYICLAGEVVVSNSTQELTLAPMDSVQFAPDEPRQIMNRGTEPATLLLIMENG